MLGCLQFPAMEDLEVGINNPVFTGEWLRANGYDREWLERWFAPRIEDKAAVTEWLNNHQGKDKRLIVRRY